MADITHDLRAKNASILADIVANLLGVERSSIDDHSSQSSIEGWDSLLHINLVVELERVYRVRFSYDDIQEMTSVGAIRDRLRAFSLAI